MKNLFLAILINSFLIFGCSQSGAGNLTNVDAILSHLKEQHKDLDEDDICIDEIDGFSAFFIVGYFAHDRGCGNPDYYFEGEEITLDKKATKKILMNGNFEQDNIAAVEAYHKGVTNHYEYSLSTMPDDFDESKHAFSEPSTVIDKDLIVSEIWIQERSGMLPEVSFHLSMLIVDLEGNLVDHQTSNHFTVQY
ncbi:MAG: hypothetical protein GQ574_19790 [Crocinitomix sp.]|nr:hypothetical protein [Crocinitomix sp.]